MLRIILAGAVLAGCSGKGAPAADSVPIEPSIKAGQPLVLEGVTVVDTRTGQLLEDRVVAIESGKIIRITDASAMTEAASANRVDARGKFLVPGYLDMHAHTAEWSDPVRSARLMLSTGITGYRQMSGSDELLRRRAAGDIKPFPDAPELLIMPGAVIIEQIASSPEMTIAEVNRQATEGADFIKVVDLPPDLYMLALVEANRLGLPFVGHMPSTIRVDDAASAGMRAIEHLGPRSSILISCSSQEDPIRQAIADSPPGGVPVLPDFVARIMSPVINHVVTRMLVNPILMGDDEEFALMQRLVDTYDDSKCRALAASLATSGMWQIPTLIRIRTGEFGDAAEYRNDPNLKYVAQEDRELWESVGQDFAEDISADNREKLERFFGLQLKLAGLFDRAGVKMLAGSDTGGSGWEVPGFSLHQEFDLLEQAGISPLHVLQMTTINGAVFLDREASMGSVEVGKEANLVLLDANPIASVQNLHAVHAVIRNGNYYSVGDLEELRDGN